MPPAQPRLVHGDLGLTHIRVQDGQVSGVIDWGDAGVGDPGIDLAATVIGPGPDFGGSVASAYGPMTSC